MFRLDWVPLSPFHLLSPPPQTWVCLYPAASICDSSTWGGPRATRAALPVGARAKTAWTFQILLLSHQWLVPNVFCYLNVKAQRPGLGWDNSEV